MADSALYPRRRSLGIRPVRLACVRSGRVRSGSCAACLVSYTPSAATCTHCGASACLVRGVLARPTLRYLVVCGVDYAETGRAPVALVASGLVADGTLPGSTARLADDLDAAASAAPGAGQGRRLQGLHRRGARGRHHPGPGATAAPRRGRHFLHRRHRLDAAAARGGARTASGRPIRRCYCGRAHAARRRAARRASPP